MNDTERILEKLDRLQCDVNKIALNQIREHETVKGHVSQSNGRTIHHTPPCEALEDHVEGHRRESKLYISIFGLIIAFSSLAFSIVYAIIK